MQHKMSVVFAAKLQSQDWTRFWGHVITTFHSFLNIIKKTETRSSLLCLMGGQEPMGICYIYVGTRE